MHRRRNVSRVGNSSEDDDTQALLERRFKRPSSVGPMIVKVLVILGVAAALVLGIFGAIAFTRVSPNGSFENESILTNKLNSTMSTTDMLSAQQIVTDNLSSENGTITNLESTTIVSETAMIDTIKTDIVCPNVLLHTQDAEIPSTHEMHHIQGPTPPPAAATVAEPLNSMPEGALTALPATASGGLQVRGLYAPVSIVDRGSGVKWVQLGVPEPTFYFDEFAPGDTPPNNGETVNAFFDVDPAAFPAGMGSIVVDLQLDVSTETGFDFVYVYKNGEPVPGAKYSGWVSALQPFKSFTITNMEIAPYDRIEIRYVKDDIYIGGLDYVLVRPVNMRYVPATIPLKMNLEPDLVGYVGKRIRVCSMDGDVHNVTAAPNAWNYEGSSWDSIRFQKGAMCCIEFTALSSTKADVTSGISPGCALVCNGPFCVDPRAPAESNSLIGDWLMQDLASYNEYFIAMMRFSLEGSQLKVTRYSGTPFWNIHEWNAYEEEQWGTPGEFPGGTISKEEIVTVIGHGAVEMTSISQSQELRSLYQVQKDGVTAAMSLSFAVDFLGIGFYRKVEPGSVKIVLSDQTDAVSDYNTNSLINQFREFATITQTMYNPQMADDLQSSIYPGEAGAAALLEKIISEGYGTYVSNITDVWPSFQDCIYFCGAGFVGRTTSIFTDKFTESTNYVRVEISGFGTGSDPNSPYTLLNGAHRVKRGGDLSLAYRDLKEIYTAGHYKHDDHRYMINIDVDSTSIRSAGRIYHPDVDGKATFTVIHMPVTEASLPGDYFAAVHKWLVHVVFQIHTFMIIPVSFTHNAFSSFDALHFNAEAFGAEADYGDTRYAFPVNFGGTRTTDTTRGLVNDKYEQVQVRASDIVAAPYHTPHENYLSEKYHLWWAVDPNTASNPNDVTGRLVSDYGYNADGSRFMFTYAPIGSIPTFPYPGAPQAANGTQWAPVSAGGSTGLTARRISFGRVNPAFVSEETAYLYIPDAAQGDPAALMLLDEFIPDGTQGYPDMTTINTPVYVYMWAEAMAKIMSWNPTRIIIDSRTNNGGYPAQIAGFASFIGDTRTSPEGDQYARRVGYGHSPLITKETLFTSGVRLAEPQSLDDYISKEILQRTINVQRVTELFPSSVFQGPGKRVSIMTSIRSASAGDMISWYFIGDDPNNSRDVGANVTLEIVGNVDGRLSGASAAIPFMTTVTSDTIHNQLGQKRGYIRSTSETLTALGKPGYPSLVNQHPATQPDLLLSGFIGDSHWVEEGIITPYPDPPLPGWTAAGSLQEVTQVDCVAGGAINQNGTLTVNSVSTSYVVWFNKDGGGAAPLVMGATAVEVAINTGDSSDKVAIATVNALGLLGDFFVEFLDSDSFTIRNKIAGAVTASAEVDSGNTISQVQASASGVVGEVLTSDKSTWRDRWLEKTILF